MVDVVIVSAVRTPIGKFGGSLASLTAVDLGTVAAQAAIERAGLDPEMIDQAIFGNVLQANSGQNVARQIALKAGMATDSTAMTINEVCGSGLKAVRLGQSAIVMGDADIVLVGGTESMSNAPHYLPKLRDGYRYGNTEMVDAIFRDGLSDAFTGEAMGVTAENVAERFGITREQQDEFALQSHRKAVAAWEAGDFEDEIVPVTVRKHSENIIVSRDEGPRPNTSLEKLATLRSVFMDNGTVTAGNASGINDGASALILMRKDLAQERGIKYLAEIRGYREGGIDPDFMGYAPKHVIEKLMKSTGSSLDEMDLVEVNEAFAAQSLAVSQQLKLDNAKLNIHGGAIALGHPLGCSGARILTTLIHALRARHEHNGVAALCVGGGIGVAMQVEVM
ncbi:acetyl-CoA C-acetyltransferase [Alloscardovia theropitheci]|uniref:Probable acetyl-CoA acetyltransferase n=1 Tax=Alloscardovia theropitheci TaxID=2496842 RepID=A0A4R0QXZ7_9BIFI|nr:acetyl-CoA C-acetyltransferase [Alloscardovia theropitheci]TCD54580.1 acetyl-CoA C-acetyltransferase [Alloscardovia theropitheci]